MRRNQYDVLEVVIGPASCSGQFQFKDPLLSGGCHSGHGTLAAALYWCVRTSYGDDAPRAAADCWLRVFEEQLEGSSDLPELTRITATAIALFVSRLVLAVNARFQNRTVWKHALAIMRQLKVPQLRAARGTLTDLTI